MNKNIIMSYAVMAILFLGFHLYSFSPYSPSQAMAQKLDLSNLRDIGNSEILSEIDIQSMMEGDVQDILEKFMGLIPFNNNNNNMGANPGQIGVLIYTHGNPSDPMHGHSPEKTEPIKETLERLGYPSEIVTHMSYNWDEGLAKLDEKGVKYVIFLYTDLYRLAYVI